MGEWKPGTHWFDPARNPAVLDTLTWSTESLLRSVSAQTQGFWERALTAMRGGKPLPDAPGIKLYENSSGHLGNNSYLLLEIEDGQHALVEFAMHGGGAAVDNPLLHKKLSNGAIIYFHEANAKNLHRVYSKAAPEKLPQALPMTPRLGIGTRMSKAVWPGIWQALNDFSFSANTIQNSRRELNLLEDLLARKVGQRLYYPGIGFVPEGHTGSTFEGLWLCGVTEGLKAGVARPYGADADHIMVKRGIDGLEKAKKVLTAARYYSFFTIDVSDILDYSAFLSNGQVRAGEDLIQRCIGDEKIRKDVLVYHRKALKVDGHSIRLSEPQLEGLVGKYWQAMEAIDILIPFIKSMRSNESFDLELSIDEHPPEIHPFDCLTSEVEVAFILAEMKRRGSRLTHIAPNLGVEKHVDYRYRDGLEGLEARTRALHRLADRDGVVIDCHSGDDLSERTRRALKRATGGMIHFKISPYLQELFADVLFEVDRKMFGTWWDDTYDFVRENAREGSTLAADCLKQYESEPEASPHPKYALFRLFCYATVGKRDAQGNFVHREQFYSLAPEFYVEYTRRVKSYLGLLAQDLLP
jgi:hypothetical protein